MGNHNPPRAIQHENQSELFAVQAEIAGTIKKINDLQDSAVAKNSEVAAIIKKAKRPGKGETFYQRKARVDALFSATVSAEDIITFVQALVARARAGDIPAIQVILERLAGKPQSNLDLTSGGEPLDTRIELILDVSRGPGQTAIEEGDATRVESLSSPSGADAAEPTSDGAVELPRSNIV
jgi:hypothetical protein